MKRLRITDANFTTTHNWLFKLVDSEGNIYFIMNDDFYRGNNLKNPISKKELDILDVGQWLNANVFEIDRKKIVKNIV